MYSHKVQYYETDKMGITHHSNYIRWMEEARIFYLGQLGYDYDKLEEDGIISPVIGVNCNYKKTTTFADRIDIETRVIEFNGVKLKLYYEMKNEAGDIVFTGESMHCFLDANGRPIRLEKQFPDFYQTMLQAIVTKE